MPVSGSAPRPGQSDHSQTSVNRSWYVRSSRKADRIMRSNLAPLSNSLVDDARSLSSTSVTGMDHPLRARLGRALFRGYGDVAASDGYPSTVSVPRQRWRVLLTQPVLSNEDMERSPQSSTSFTG